MDQKQAKKAYMDDKQMFEELYYAEQYSAKLYNDGAISCTSEQIKEEMINLLFRAHEICGNTFDEMSKRGWLISDKADSSSVEKEKQKCADTLSSF